MKDAIKVAPRSTRRIVFGAYFLLLLAMALFPPFYLSVSGSAALVAGIPLPIFYWVSNAVLAGLGVWALYIVESVNGELPEEGNPNG
ncbi:hypothetical protein [Paraburkholderia sp.]|jgi:membrane protein implicated in regulation of membrane protease activity|uniref:hypothetical protein n=1 Tax=Paraburkholderia sp. TaxID=1926495 RepID=UPI000EFC4A45|nr:hypothetical protein [Paraburkholderia sp.]